jgi:hypothetical protein
MLVTSWIEFLVRIGHQHSMTIGVATSLLLARLGVSSSDACPLACPVREALPVATLPLVQLTRSLAYANLLTTVTWKRH